MIMALDHDTLYSHPTPIVDTGWLQQIYSYVQKFPQLAVEWELPTYCRIWKLHAGWSSQTCEYPEAAKLVHDLQHGIGGRTIDDRSQALDNPYIHYTDNHGRYWRTAKVMAISQTAGFNKTLLEVRTYLARGWYRIVFPSKIEYAF